MAIGIFMEMSYTGELRWFYSFYVCGEDDLIRIRKNSFRGLKRVCKVTGLELFIIFVKQRVLFEKGV